MYFNKGQNMTKNYKIPNISAKPTFFLLILAIFFFIYFKKIPPKHIMKLYLNSYFILIKTLAF